ncbi:MAG TPA: beta-galactosidase GalA [Sphingomicrobium sp.]|nr:beta-galactosidase GalA [Sphingomicrobium sp.]
MRRRTFLQASLAGSAFLATSATGQRVAKGAEPVSPRRRELLSEGWRFHLGNAVDIEKDFSFGHNQATYAKAGAGTADAAYADFNESDWQRITVPHDWAVELPFAPPPHRSGKNDFGASAHGFKAIGRDFPENSIGWYRLRLPVTAADKGQRVSLEFDGVFRDCLVFVNGYIIKRHESGYAPFSVDISDFLDFAGKDELAVRADASLGEGWFYEGAGIYRNVWLVATDPLHIPQWGVFVRSDVNSAGALLHIASEIANASETEAAVDLVHRVIAPGGMKVASGGGGRLTLHGSETGKHYGEIHLSAPLLWSLEQPNLYTLATELRSGGHLVDRFETRFGIRTIRFDPAQGFFLNGKRVKLLGTCNHQDHAGVGTGIPDRLHYWRIEQMKRMGSNAWRSAHNPPAEVFLNACDELGMLVLDETRQNSSSEEAVDELTRMVRRDRNHPSVILWSVGNEEPHQGTARGATISHELLEVIRSLDPTRPVTQAFDQHFGEGATRVVDVVGFNYRTDQMPAYHARFPNQPIIGTETGSTVSTRGEYFNDPKRHYVRAYDTEHPWWATTAEEWWKIVGNAPYIAGGFVWTGFDYRGEPTPYLDFPSTTSQFGLMDLCGFPKDNYWYYRAWWRPEPMLHLFPHWNWTGREGQPIDVWAYGNCDSVELFVNGLSAGVKPMERFGHVAWSIPYAPGRIEAIARNSGRIIARAARETTGAAEAVQLSADRLRIAADGRDLSVITAAIVDSKGRLVPHANNRVDFSLVGTGRLIGIGNGNPTSVEPDKASFRSTFNGLAQALVQSDGRVGGFDFTGASAGLRPGRVRLLTI